MRASGEGRFPAEEDSSSESVATAVVDEEKNQPSKDTSSSDSANEDETPEFLNAAWGKHGRVWMWIGCVFSLQFKKNAY
jgi:hypothetical protein